MKKICLDNPPNTINVGGNTFNTLNRNEIVASNKATQTPTRLAQWTLSWIAWVAGILGIIFVIYGGFKFVTSGGDQDKLKKARSTLLYAVIGIIVAIMSYGLFRAVTSLA